MLPAICTTLSISALRYESPVKKREASYRKATPDERDLNRPMQHIIYMLELSQRLSEHDILRGIPKYDQDTYREALHVLKKKGMIRPNPGKDPKTFSVPETRILEAQTYSRGFVSSTYSELSKENGSKTPFFHRGPIRDDQFFFGRKRETTQILERIRQLEDCSLIGPRGIGKTSLLNHLSSLTVLTDHSMAPARFFFVYFDLQQVPNDMKRDTFFRELYNHTLYQLRRWPPIMPGAPLESFSEKLPNLVKKGRRSQFEFYHLDELLRLLAEEDVHVTYLFDEFESVVNNPNFDFDFYGRLRALSGSADYFVSLITASKKNLFDLTFSKEVKTSPFFRYFEDFPLGGFTEEDLEECYVLAQQRGVYFTEEMKGIIIRWSGLHPFLVQLACDFFFRMVAEGEDLDGRSEGYLLRRFLTRHRKHFTYFWRQLDKEEQEGLEKVRMKEDIESIAPSLLYRLEQGHYIHTGPDGPEVFSTAFASYLEGARK